MNGGNEGVLKKCCRSSGELHVGPDVYEDSTLTYQNLRSGPLQT